MIQRTRYLVRIKESLARSPITAILGPRQCGKTTLARQITHEIGAHFFDLESPSDQLRLSNPELVLSGLEGLVILDEIQTQPHLYPILRVLADRPGRMATFLILGSASPDLIRKASETLAGRVEFIDLHGFDLAETGWATWMTSWIRGGFPRSFLAKTDRDSKAWREGFVRTFLERDLPQFGVQIPAPAMRRFWMMLAHWHGQLWNASELGRSMGMSDHLVRSHLDVLTETFMVRQLQPWHENLGKRQVKAPKIYLRDSGILHTLLNAAESNSLMGHPKVGASWEGFAMEQVIRLLNLHDPYFWATYSGAELDLFVMRNGKRLGYEFKYSEKPSITRSMRVAIDDLSLDHLWIVCPGKVHAQLDDGISAIGIESIMSAVEQE